MITFVSIGLILSAIRATNVSMGNLKSLTTKELKNKWQEIFKMPAPKGYTKSYLVKELTWYYQDK